MKNVEMLHEKGVSNVDSHSFHLVFDNVCFHHKAREYLEVTCIKKE
jgi:hypothetical protein